MGVGIVVDRFAVRGPTGMADTGNWTGRCVVQHIGQGRQPARPLLQPQPVLLQYHPGRVVTTVFETAESGDQNGKGRFCTGDSNDSTHSSEPIGGLVPRS